MAAPSRADTSQSEHAVGKAGAGRVPIVSSLTACVRPDALFRQLSADVAASVKNLAGKVNAGAPQIHQIGGRLVA